MRARKPHYLTDEMLASMIETVINYKDNIRKDIIFKGVTWN